jgi:hypothetical protein
MLGVRQDVAEDVLVMSAHEIAKSFRAWLCPVVGNPSGDKIERRILAIIVAERAACAKIISERAARCDEHGTEHFCEQFGCHSLDDLVAEIKARP